MRTEEVGKEFDSTKKPPWELKGGSYNESIRYTKINNFTSTTTPELISPNPAL